MTEPQIDIPLSEAVESLTGFEVIAVQKHFNKQLDDMGGVELLMAAVWAWRKRANETTTWNDVKAMTIRDLKSFFPEEPREPDGEMGKESSGVDATT